MADPEPRFKKGDMAFDCDNDICEIVEWHGFESKHCGWAKVKYICNRVGTLIPTEKTSWQMCKNLFKERQR